MKAKRIHVILGFALIIIIALALGLNREGLITGTGSEESYIQQWDLNAINTALKANGFINKIDAADTNGLTTKTILYLANGPYKVPYAVTTGQPIFGEWPDKMGGVCVSDNPTRSIQFSDGRTDMFPGLPTLNHANLTEEERTKILKDVSLNGLDPHHQKYEVCKAYANYRNASVFGLQYWGWCLVGTTNEVALGNESLRGHKYTNYGKCGHLEGAGWLNNVYARTTTKGGKQYAFDSAALNVALVKIRAQGYSDLKVVIPDNKSDNNGLQ